VKVFEKGVEHGMYRAMLDDVRRKWRNLHNEELFTKY
jgi:hypothetical protein